MSELEDLQASQKAMSDAVTAASAMIADEAAKIAAFVPSITGVDPAAVEASAVAIKAMADSLTVAVAAATQPPVA